MKPPKGGLGPGFFMPEDEDNHAAYFYRASCGNFQKRTGPVVDFREEVLT